tara:strand:+ start:746 stop:1072 length:327 start_codon:yes stop_codon:yes gene_type:complete
MNMARAGRVVRRKRKRTDDLASIEDTLMRCEFSEMPRASHEELTMLYDRGVLDWSTYCRLIGASVGVSSSDVVTGADPWTQQDRREFMGARPKRNTDNASSGEVLHWQ